MREKRQNDTLSFEWTYNNRGQTARFKDYVNEVEYRYEYDSLGRLVEAKGSNETGAKYDYDLNNNVTETDYRGYGSRRITSFEYGKEDRLSKTTLPNGIEVSNSYDRFSRLSERLNLAV